MGLRDYLKQAKESMAAGMRGEGPSAEALASLTPEQRAAYDARMAEVAAAMGGAQAQHEQLVADHDARVVGRPLQGPAGEWLYGPATYPGADPSELAGMTVQEMLRGELGRLRDQAADVAADPLGLARPPSARPPAPDHERAGVAASERAERDAARRPFVAPERIPHVITRLSARAGSELDEVAAHLASGGLASRPDLVFGCYRVPDHIGTGTLSTPGSRYVEWDIVHAASADGLTPGPPPAAATMGGRERWVARAAGEPSVLDEDLAIAYLASRGIGPDRTLGVARGVRVRSIRASHDGDASTTVISVSGVHVLHAAAGDDEAAFAAWADGRPVEVPAAGHPGVRVEVLDWGAIAEAIWPESHRPVPVPSPFPYLPSSPQELLGAYLEVVGIHPAHCYAASVVEDQPRSIDGVSVAAGGLIQTRTNLGAPQPCADGKDRRRLAGGVHVVVAHLDAPAYVEGRERWERYQREVLQANLAAETGARRPVHDASWSDLPPGLRGLVRGAEALDRLTDVFDAEWNGRFAPHRYCWPASG